MICETARPCSGPERTFASTAAFRVALIYPIALGIAKALLQFRASRLLALGDQVLVCPIEIRVVLHDGAIETGALINRGR
jgi:hypothetical protein